MDRAGTGDHEAVRAYEYFMLRVARGTTARLQGTVERLATREKWEFGTQDDLLELLGGNGGEGDDGLR